MEIVVNVVVGSVGLLLIFCVIEVKKIIGIVNKEMLVIVGYFVMEVVWKYNVLLFLVDSEYLVIF